MRTPVVGTPVTSVIVAVKVCDDVPVQTGVDRAVNVIDGALASIAVKAPASAPISVGVNPLLV